MANTTVLLRGPLSAIDYRCTSGPIDRPFPEHHEGYSIAYVRRGSFGCRTHGVSFELVTGSVLVGYPGDEFTCTHDLHDRGDECLCFHLTNELIETIGGRTEVWRVGCLPPMPELMILGELAQAAATGHTDVGLDEAGLLFAARFVDVASERTRETRSVPPSHRRRVVEAARWIDAHSHEAIALERAARQAGLSSFHFLRVFSATLGVTPHQDLIRSRLRRATRLLTDDTRPIGEVALEVGFRDLSNFVRTFHRAAGVSPRGFRRTARDGKKVTAASPPHRGAADSFALSQVPTRRAKNSRWTCQ